MKTSAPTSTSPTPQHLWRRARGLLLAAAILALAGIAIAALRSGGDHGYLDPRSPAPNGTKALSRLLADRGVHTEVVTSSAEALAQAGPDTTLLVPSPDSLNERQRDQIRDAARRSGRTVLVAPGPEATETFAPGVRAVSTEVPVQPVPPDCEFPAARRAGDAELGGHRYSTKVRQATTCYLRQGKASLLHLPTPRTDSSTSPRDTVLLGAPEPLYNDHLAKHGNASLALQLLGSQQELIWYVPSADDTAPPKEEERGFFDLLPSGWSWAFLQLAVAAVLAALWRARRLGPLVHEKLPVAVPAAEATEGRARLYRKAHARGHAANALRTASRTRLARLAGIPHAQAHTPDVLVPALAARLNDLRSPGRPPHDGSAISSLLFGSAPPDDAALVRLADDLDQLEQRLTSDTSVPPSRDKDRPS